MKIYLSTLLMVMFTGRFELYLPGLGCISTSTIIRINCNTNNRNTILYALFKTEQEATDLIKNKHKIYVDYA